MSDLSVPFVDDVALKGMAEGNTEVCCGASRGPASILSRTSTQHPPCRISHCMCLQVLKQLHDPGRDGTEVSTCAIEQAAKQTQLLQQKVTAKIHGSILRPGSIIFNTVCFSMPISTVHRSMCGSKNWCRSFGVVTLFVPHTLLSCVQ